MLETLQSTTLAVGYGLLATPTTTSATGIKLEKDNEGSIEAIGIKVIPTALGTTASSATTATGIGQEINYQRALEDVRSAQAYVESLDDEQLAELSLMLDEKKLEFEFADELQIAESVEEPKTFIKI